MKRRLWFWLGIGMTLGGSAPAAVPLPFYESFPNSYAEGEYLGSGASAVIWNRGNSPGAGGPTNTSAASLSHGGLLTTADSRGIRLSVPPSSNRDRGFDFSPAVTVGAENPTLYASFLLNVQTAPSQSRRVAYFRNSTSSGTASAGLILNAANQLQLLKSSDTAAAAVTSALTPGTHLVVFRYRWVSAASGDDEVALWLNPGSLGVAEGDVPPPSIATTSGSDVANLNALFISQQTGASGVLWLDEVRVATNWSGVTPTNGTPPPSTLPLITEVIARPAAVILRGTNGTPNGVYQVLSSTSLTTPLASWPAIATNLFDANGHFDSTNAVSPADDQRFYRILVGGQITWPPGSAPEILSQPTNQVVLAGEPASFSVTASGLAPLAYQWFFNTNTALVGATRATLVLTNSQSEHEGSYSVRVTNAAGAATSLVATLIVNVPPAITTPPASQAVLVSNAAAFTVVATGDAPLRYQWYFSPGTLLLHATNASYVIPSAGGENAGDYFVVVTNDFGTVTSSLATLTVNLPWTNSADFNLYGFGWPATGSGQLPESDPNYRKVYTPGDLRLALANNNTKVIEIMNDLNLGWNEIGASNQTGAFRPNATPNLHPVLLASGVTLIDIQNKNGLTIFSANGATIRHAEFNLKRAHNVLIRNLKFDELWEWDEDTKGDYDSKDWDFITIGDGGSCTNVWIDHCDFTKSYDGVLDIKGGDNNVTISWCRFLGDDGGPGSFVRQQIEALEASAGSHAMYDFLRSNGFSVENIIAITRSQKKGHLAGATEFSAANAGIRLTLHHNYYYNFQDRIPRLRAGNAHVYNVYVNNTEALAAKNLRDAIVAAIPGGLGSYKFDVTLNGAISTEDGAVLVEKCYLVDVRYPLRNNQTDPANPDYTGKIRAEDTIYSWNGSTFRGNTEDVGSPLVPVPAPLKPFSWNGFATLPYAYPVNDPATIAAAITNNAGHAVVFWAKTNWFKTSY